MGQSIWNFFWPTPLSAFPKMLGTTLEWTLPITPLLPVSAGDPLSQDSLLQSLSTNLLTFCWGVKIPSLTPHYHASSHLHPPPSTSLSGGWTFTINEHWKKQVPMGILCPLVLSMWMCVPVDLAPLESPLESKKGGLQLNVLIGLLSEKPYLQCVLFEACIVFIRNSTWIYFSHQDALVNQGYICKSHKQFQVAIQQISWLFCLAFWFLVVSNSDFCSLGWSFVTFNCAELYKT